MARPVLLMTMAAFVLPGCDWMMRINAEVRVEAAAQQAIATWPQQLLLRHEVLERDTGPAAAYRIAVLCEPSAEPFVAKWRFERLNGCGEPSPITAWLESLDPAAGLPCGPTGAEGEVVGPDSRPPVGSLSATAGVFEGGGRCPHRADIVLSIAPPAP
jgi:hypothetical protein